MNNKDDIQTQVASLSAKLKGLAFLFSGLNLEGQEENREAMAGIAELLRELASQSVDIRNQLEQIRLPGSAQRKAAKSNPAPVKEVAKKDEPLISEAALRTEFSV